MFGIVNRRDKFEDQILRKSDVFSYLEEKMHEDIEHYDEWDCRFKKKTKKEKSKQKKYKKYTDEWE